MSDVLLKAPSPPGGEKPGSSRNPAAAALRNEVPQEVSECAGTYEPAHPNQEQPERDKQLQVRAEKLESWFQLQSAVLRLGDGRLAAKHLVTELQRQFGCSRVAIGLRRRRNGNCRLVALSDVGRFSARAATVRDFEAAMDETVLQRDMIVWPSSDESLTRATHAHRQLSKTMGNLPVVSIPLRESPEVCQGALVFLGTDLHRSLEHLREFNTTAAPPIGAVFAILRRPIFWPIARWWHSCWMAERRRRTCLIIAALLACCAGLAVPLPYTINCECDVQPVARRFVVAPFDGALEKALAFPGDVVQEGQPLARMDGRDIRCELAGVTADYSRVAKERDAAMASGQTGAAQIARLEMEQLQLKRELLEHRETQLLIKSPLSGILISGDLEKIEGAKLSVGQTLFEVGPLDEMAIEVAVPEAEITHTMHGSPVRIHLDAVAGRTWNATIEKVHPRSEIRDDRNVFVAEVKLVNQDGVLRPGMKGTAKITGPTRPLAWNLFHKPWYAVLRWLGV